MKRKPDFTYLSLGGGVQSGTIAEMIAEGELSPPDAIYFADTGIEPSYVYDYINYLSKRLPVEITTVTAGNMLDDINSGGRFAALPLFTVIDGKAGKLKRQCTSEYKIRPIERQLRKDLMDRGLARKTGAGIRVNKGLSVECWLGISLDEVQRMKPNPHKFITNRWPLIDLRMSRHDCKLWLTRKGLPVPDKSSCIICPYHDDFHYHQTKQDRPDDWGVIVGFDHSLRNGETRLAATSRGEVYLHSQCIPIDEVEFVNDQPSLFDICDTGYCFV